MRLSPPIPSASLSPPIRLQLMLMHILQLWHYPAANLLTEIPHSGIPSWVPWCYFVYTSPVAQLTRYLKKVRPPAWRWWSCGATFVAAVSQLLLLSCTGACFALDPAYPRPTSCTADLLSTRSSSTLWSRRSERWHAVQAHWPDASSPHPSAAESD